MAKKGERNFKEPIKDLESIKTIDRMLKDSPRDRLLFNLGISNGLRASDLVALKVGQVRNLAVGEPLRVFEQKTGKPNYIVLNGSTRRRLDEYLKAECPKDSDYLFKSRKGANKPIRPVQVSELVKRWCKAINLDINAGSHTLRKTWGYTQRTFFGASWELIAKRFNHSAPSVTRSYLGISDDEVNGLLSNDLFKIDPGTIAHGRKNG